MKATPSFGLEWALSSCKLSPRSEEPYFKNGSFVVYYRVSTQYQERSGLGLEGQRTAVERFLTKWNGRVVREFTEIEDGRKRRRPELRKALGTCRVLGAKLLIAQLDRLARNAAFVAMLIETGTDFYAVDFPMAGTFDKHILAAVAEHEVKQMSNRRKAACAVMKARGFKFCQHLEGLRTYHPESLAAARAEILRREMVRAAALAPLLKELKAVGKSVHGIAVELTRMGIEAPRGGDCWYSSSIKRLFELIDERPPARRNQPSGPARQEVRSRAKEARRPSIRRKTESLDLSATADL